MTLLLENKLRFHSVDLLQDVNLLTGLWKQFWTQLLAGSSELFSVHCNCILEEVTDSMLTRIAKNKAFRFPESTSKNIGFAWRLSSSPKFLLNFFLLLNRNICVRCEAFNFCPVTWEIAELYSNYSNVIQRNSSDHE